MAWPMLGDLVRGQIVHHLEVSGTERRDQDLPDIGAKLLAVDRAVEHDGLWNAARVALDDVSPADCLN